MEVDIPSEYVYLCGKWTEKYFNQKMFFLDLPISDELAALPFGFLLFQIPKISSDVSTTQPISDELGTSLFLAFPKFPKMNRNAFYCVWGQKAAPNLAL